MLHSQDIEHLLKNDKSMFLEMIDDIVKENIIAVQEELDELDKFNKVLYETVEFSLNKLYEEEGILSRLFYNSFGIGKRNNKRRQQLVTLGSTLKGHISQLQRDRKRIGFYHEKIVIAYQSLKSMAKQFSTELKYLDKEPLEEKCNAYLKVIYENMDEVDGYKRSLEMKDIYLESCISSYRGLLRKIPKHSEVGDERHLSVSL